MAERGVSALKFVGTVSLGLLTGASYTLSTLTIPALLTLPNADTAARAFDDLARSARRHLGTLSTLSTTSLSLAYLLSPRWSRHPYLLYTSLLVVGARLLVTDLAAPYVGLAGPPASEYAATRAVQRKKEREQRAAAARARMEASYEVLGSGGSDAHSEGTDEGVVLGEEEVNGEEVRAKVQTFLRKQIVQTAVTAVGFVVAVVGIWGDGLQGGM
ncbi:hypothetical protein B0T18DRAFT_369372 [Schizothecium vesticola]|uniref:Autophagy-related protein 33 n=1 Tax=Schizothecium vesticola TaxID=314040 RepID=A0AA40K5J7_9PEZI|nr:hypothetical protein B0T18DRAFT_369372 [Schizothecium vesticola]